MFLTAQPSWCEEDQAGSSREDLQGEVCREVCRVRPTQVPKASTDWPALCRRLLESRSSSPQESH